MLGKQIVVESFGAKRTSERLRGMSAHSISESMPCWRSGRDEASSERSRMLDSALHIESSVRVLREGFGLGSDDVSSLPHREKRIDSDMEERTNEQTAKPSQI